MIIREICPERDPNLCLRASFLVEVKLVHVDFLGRASMRNIHKTRDELVRFRACVYAVLASDISFSRVSSRLA